MFVIVSHVLIIIFVVCAFVILASTLSDWGTMMDSVKKEPMGNGYDKFVCLKCGHTNPIVFSSSMQMLADISDKLS